MTEGTLKDLMEAFHFDLLQEMSNLVGLFLEVTDAINRSIYVSQTLVCAILQ